MRNVLHFTRKKWHRYFPKKTRTESKSLIMLFPKKNKSYPWIILFHCSSLRPQTSPRRFPQITPAERVSVCRVHFSACWITALMPPPVLDHLPLAFRIQWLFVAKPASHCQPESASRGGGRNPMGELQISDNLKSTIRNLAGQRSPTSCICRSRSRLPVTLGCGWRCGGNNGVNRPPGDTPTTTTDSQWHYDLESLIHFRHNLSRWDFLSEVSVARSWRNGHSAARWDRNRKFWTKSCCLNF